MSDSEANRPPNRRRGFKGVAIGCGISFAAIAGTALVWGLGGARWFDSDLLVVIGWVGAVISLSGVVLAYAIFRRQATDADAAEKRQIAVIRDLEVILNKVHDRVDELALRKASDLVTDAVAEEGSSEADKWADGAIAEVETSESRTADGELRLTGEGRVDGVIMTTPTGKQRRLFAPAQVPLSVLAALVATLKDSGHSGSWTLDALKGAFRATGKGNHPWFLVLVPPHEPATTEIWKVTRGPGGTDRSVRVTRGDELG